MNAPHRFADALAQSAAQRPAESLITAGWAVLDAATLAAMAGATEAELQAWRAFWDDLPPDPHLRDGGRYRRRRHGCFLATMGMLDVVPVPHRAHWQPLEYNALHGGIERWFDPLPESLASDPRWLRLLRSLAEVADTLRGPNTWAIEAHPFRIDTTDGIGRPTPEGAHRDGVDLVVVILVARHNIKGGETRVFEADGPHGVRFTLSEPFGALLLDDAHVIHETTPIQPVDPEAHGWRDTLVLTFRRNGFQGPQA
ncbi:MAG: 2OG-Fe dioxygenase family protein [Rubrivivax sp.]